MSKARSQPPPEVIADRYRVEGRVGAGAIGVVLLATDLGTGARVAVKRFDPARLQSPRAAERLLRSARAAQALTGEHVARVLASGELTDGAPYVVTEYLEGTDLRAYVERRGPIGVREAIKYLLQACEAVAEAHGAGILHRDLKPQNLFLTFTEAGHPLIKILDFGTHAVACGAEGEGALSSRSMRDSLLYMAPEQLRSGGRVDERADVWSLGGIGYLMVRGAGPFEASEPLEIVARVMDDPPPPLPAGLKAEGLEKVLRRCLEKRPEERYADVAELALALSRFGGEGAQRAAERVGEVQSASAAARAAAEQIPDLQELPEVPDLPLVVPPPELSDPGLTLDDGGDTAAAPASAAASAPARASAPAPAPASASASAPARASVPASVRASAPAPASVPTSVPAPAPAPASASAPASLRRPSFAPPLAARPRLRRALEIAAASTLAVVLLAIWLVRGRIVTIPQGSTSASARTGLAAHVIDVLRAHVDRSAARSRSADPALPSALPAPPPAPALPPEPGQPPPPGVASAGSAAPGVTPPPGGWEYPPEIIYDEVERERRRQREREAAARRGPR